MANEENKSGAGGDGGAAGAAPDQGMINAINAAVRNHLSRALPSALEGVLTPQLAALREELKPKEQPKAKDADPEGKPAGGVDPETAKQLAELKATVKAEREARIKERHEGHKERAYNALLGELAGKVRPELVADVADLLFRARGAVKVSTEGAATFKVADEDYDIKGGVAAWLKTDGAKPYIPAPTTPQKIPARLGPPLARPNGGGQQLAAGQRPDPLLKTLADLGFPQG